MKKVDKVLRWFGLKRNRNESKYVITKSTDLTRSSLNVFAKNLTHYRPGQIVELELYDSIVKTIPLARSAVFASIAFAGFPRIETYGNKNLKHFFDSFIENVSLHKTINSLKGLKNYSNQIMYNTILKGFSVSEVVLSSSGQDVDRIQIGNSNDYFFEETSKTDSTLTLWAWDYNKNKKIEIRDTKELIYISLRNQNGHPQGTGLYYSAPFISTILLRYFNAVNNTVIRIGEPIYLTKITSEYEEAKPWDAASQLQSDLTEALQDRDEQGTPFDLHAGIIKGDVDISVVGQNYTPNEMKFQLRVIMEQLITATDLAPHVFALWQWNQNYRTPEAMNLRTIATIEMYQEAHEQAIRDILEIAAVVYRKGLPKFKLIYPSVNLRDLEIKAKARLTNATAEEKELTNIITKVEMGIITEEEAVEQLRGNYNSNALLMFRKYISTTRSGKLWRDLNVA